MNAPSVLALHGFTGTPFELAPLVTSLEAAGFAVTAPLLEGHGATYEALSRATWRGGLAGVEAAFDALPAPVALIGMSMGGALAVRLAARRKEQVSALVLLGTPLRFDPRVVAAVRALARLPRAAIPKVGGSDVFDPAMRRANPSMGAFPARALASYFELVEEIRADLAEIRVPVLVVHARQDHTVPFANGLEIVARLRAPHVETLWLDHSYHLVAIDVERALVSRAVVRFLETHAGGKR